MAIVKSLAIGKARKSAGNLTYQTVKGRTIAREKPLHVANPNTPAQQAQRNRIRNLVDAWRTWFSICAPYFTYIQGFGSAYNEFIRRNIGKANESWRDPVENSFWMRRGTYVSTGKYGLASLSTTWIYPDEVPTMVLGVTDLQLRNDIRVNDRIIMMTQFFPEEGPWLAPTITEYYLTQGDVETLSNGDTIDIPFTFGEFGAVFWYSSARRLSSTARVF